MRQTPFDFEAVLADHSAGRSPGFLLWHTTLRWQRHVADRLTEVGLTHVQFLVLASVWWLGRGGGTPSQREVAEHAGLEPVMTSHVARALEQRELIVRGRSEADSRALELSLTAEGRALAQRAVVLMDGVDRDFFAPVTDPAAFADQLAALAGRDFSAEETTDPPLSTTRSTSTERPRRRRSDRD